jgi:Ca-activated chloride channel family protein
VTIYSPAAFIFLITIPIIIVLYLLKQRHREYIFSSLYLWQEALKDLEANAPWQKLRKNILMILQIVAMALLIFALSNPFINASWGEPEIIVLAIDTSLSMQATDVKPSRFEAARSKALSFAANLQPESRVTLISMGGKAVIEENLSRDKKRLMQKITDLKVTNEASDFDDASSLIQSIVKQYPGSRVVLFGDREMIIPGADTDFFNFSAQADNYAVMLLSHTKTKKGISALSRIGNFSELDADIPVSLYVDEKVFDARNVSAEPGEIVSVYWDGIPLDTLMLECRIDAKDCLEADNTAFDTVNPASSRKVLLAGGTNFFIEKALSLINGVEIFKTNREDADALKGYELYIFDGFLPPKLPDDGSIMMINPPHNDFFEFEGEIQHPRIKKSAHGLFMHVNDYSFVIGKSKILNVPAWGEEVLGAEEGTVIFAGQLDKRRVLVLGFDLNYSDIALKPAFPIMMVNSLEWLVPSGIKNIENVFPGQTIEFNLDPKVESAKVISPSGKVTHIAPPFPAEAFSDTGEIGRYTLVQKLNLTDANNYFIVNAPSEKESNLMYDTFAPETRGNTPDKPGEGVEKGLSLQGIFLWLVLLLIFVEWWVYSNGV